jgi:hypothetical protein
MINNAYASDSSTSKNLFLTSDIPKNQSCIIYNDNINTVIVLTLPIPITTKQYVGTSTITDLFEINPPQDYKNTTTTASEQVGSSLAYGPNDILGQYNDSEIYIDCQPTGVSDSEIQTYNIPIAAGLTDTIGKLDHMKTAVNFFLFCGGLILVYIGVPTLYKSIVINNVIKSFQSKDDRARYIRSSDILIFSFALLFILASFYYGFKDDDYQLVTNGLFGFVLFGISASLIRIKMLDQKFLTYDGNETLSSEYDPSITKEELDRIKTSDTKIFAILGNIIGFIRKYALFHILTIDILVELGLAIATFVFHKMTTDKFYRFSFISLIVYIPIIVTLLVFLSKQ